jgi:hypothetical protein
VAALGVCDGHDVEEKGLHVKVERLVVEEEFGQEAEVLAVLLVSGRDDVLLTTDTKSPLVSLRDKLCMAIPLAMSK